MRENQLPDLPARSSREQENYLNSLARARKFRAVSFFVFQASPALRPRWKKKAAGTALTIPANSGVPYCPTHFSSTGLMRWAFLHRCTHEATRPEPP